MKNTTVLVIEDEPSIREIVDLYLRRAGFEVTTASDGQEALKILDQDPPDLVVLDLMLPGVDGYEITRTIRAEGDTPIIMLTSRRGEVDRIAGLEMGADDYVVKPFSPQELVSRVRAVLRRTHGLSSKPREKPKTYGELMIDPSTRLVSVQGNEITLTAKEFDLLWLLARNPQQVFSRDQLLSQVWGSSDYIDPSTVTVHIHRLREKIEVDPSKPDYILTVWGVGYKFDP
jgi:DNA-binding response OmpR family regulator